MDEEGVRVKNCDNSIDHSPNVFSDPWIPTKNDKITFPKVSPVPINPLLNIISSEMYIKSLERRLNKIKRTTEQESANGMIKQLKDMKSLHMAQFITNEQTMILEEDNDPRKMAPLSAIQRKLNPEKQALSCQELVPLLCHDILAQQTEDMNVD